MNGGGYNYINICSVLKILFLLFQEDVILRKVKAYKLDYHFKKITPKKKRTNKQAKKNTKPPQKNIYIKEHSVNFKRGDLFSVTKFNRK